MGRIKSLMVKRAAKQLLVKHVDKFDESFENNKKILGNTMPSKAIRNKIAGYISRLQKQKRISATEAAKPKQEIAVSEEPLQADVY